MTAVYLQAAIAVVFGLAAFGKARRPSQAVAFVAALGVPRRWAYPFVYAVVFLEASAMVWLLAGVAVLAAAIVASVIAVALVTVQIGARVRAIDTGCGCFGAMDSDDHAVMSFGRAICLASAALGLVIALSVSPSHVRAPAVIHSPLLAFVGLLTGVAFVVATSLLAELVHFENHRPRPVLLVPDTAAADARRS